MTINIITIYPDFFISATRFSILKRAQEKGLIKFNIINLRDFAEDNYKSIDDHPYGGGPGMVMMLPPIYRALQSLNINENVILPSAKGEQWAQSMAKDFSTKDEITFIVPHFEGIDERVTENFINYEICVGPYVLSGGEFPTMTIIDTIVRLIPGALGNPESLVEESFSFDSDSEKEYPQYTKPQEFHIQDDKILRVPNVLLSGDHKKIEAWRQEKRKKVTNTE